MGNTGVFISSKEEVRHSVAVYVLAVAALLACLIAYGMSLDGPLFFDDVPNLLENPVVKTDGRAFDDWRAAALSSDAGLLYRPVAMLSFAMNHAVSGSFSAFSLKATNLAIHIVNGGLVYLFIVALLSAPALRARTPGVSQRRLVAAIAASIWLLHPIHVSTVLYAVQRMGQLSALFTLSGLLLFARYRLRWVEARAGTGELIAAFLWILILGLLAILSKENGVLLPWLIVVLEVTLFQGVWNGRSRVRLIQFSWIVFFLPVLLTVALVVLSPDLLPGTFATRDFTLEERLLTQSRVLWQYLGWILIPDVFSMGFFHDDIPVSQGLWSPATTALSLVAWGSVILVALLKHRAYPLFAFAILFFLVAHSVESTVIPLELVFEHRNYLPGVSIAGFVAIGVVRCCRQWEKLRLRFALGGILGILVMLLVVRTHAWREEITLARFNVINHPASARANFFYANALFKRFQQSEALGLSEAERRELAVASRGYFERMHSIDEQDFAALVMLYQLDTLYFPKLAEDNDWLAKMEALVTTRRLKSSDRTALGALAVFSTRPPGEPGRERVGRLMGQLVTRYPRRIDLLAERARFLSAIEPGVDTTRETLLATLERAVRANPGKPKPYAYLAQYHGTDDLASSYEAIRQWMLRDPLRRELPQVKRIFDR